MGKSKFNPFATSIPGWVSERLESFAQSFQTCIPAIVKKTVDRSKVIATPAVQLTDSDGNAFDWADVTLTVLTPFGQNVFMSFPIAAGDTGWIVAADMDTSLFKKAKKPARQNTFERHKYRFGFFIPDKINGFTIADADKNSFLISNLDGSTRITVSESEIGLIAGNNELKINGSSITINATGGDVIVDGISLKNHTHTVPENISVTVSTSTGVGSTTATATTSKAQKAN